jgi:hypothetical protein
MTTGARLQTSPRGPQLQGMEETHFVIVINDLAGDSIKNAFSACTT